MKRAFRPVRQLLIALAVLGVSGNLSTLLAGHSLPQTGSGAESLKLFSQANGDEAASALLVTLRPLPVSSSFDSDSHRSTLINGASCLSAIGFKPGLSDGSGQGPRAAFLSAGPTLVMQHVRLQI